MYSPLSKKVVFSAVWSDNSFISALSTKRQKPKPDSSATVVEEVDVKPLLKKEEPSDDSEDDDDEQPQANKMEGLDDIFGGGSDDDYD